MPFGLPSSGTVHLRTAPFVRASIASLKRAHDCYYPSSLRRLIRFTSTTTSTGRPFSDLVTRSRSPLHHPHRLNRPSSTTPAIRTMSSDADYAAFLEKANQDVSGGSAGTQNVQGASGLGKKAVDTEVPAPLARVQEYFVSDADEPFEPVALKYSGPELLSGNNFAKLIGHEGEIEELEENDFDPRGQYGAVVEAVRQAATGTVAFFKVKHDGTRSEYWVVAVNKDERKIVGLKALAVES